VRTQGIFLATVNGKRRTVYIQFDGSTELADVCACRVDWTPDFTVTRTFSCPIDQHRARAIREASDNDLEG